MSLLGRSFGVLLGIHVSSILDGCIAFFLAPPFSVSPQLSSVLFVVYMLAACLDNMMIPFVLRQNIWCISDSSAFVLRFAAWNILTARSLLQKFRQVTLLCTRQGRLSDPILDIR